MIKNDKVSEQGCTFYPLAVIGGLYGILLRRPGRNVQAAANPHAYKHLLSVYKLLEGPPLDATALAIHPQKSLDASSPLTL
jgi:hypothetical protein